MLKINSQIRSWSDSPTGNSGEPMPIR